MSNETFTPLPVEHLFTCIVCGKESKSDRHNRKFCSDKSGVLTTCQKEGEKLKAKQRRAARNGKTCCECCKPFQAKKINQKFCSDACKMKRYRRNKKGSMLVAA